MAYTRTLLQLRKSLAMRAAVAGPTGDTASQSLTATVLNEFLNEALTEAWDTIVGKWEDYYTKSTTITVTSGVDEYAIPSDFYKLRRLWVNTTGTEWKRLYPGDIDMAHRYTNVTLADHGYRYRLQERNLVLMPVPSQAETLRMFYIPTAPQLVNDGDAFTFDVPVEAKLVLAIAWRECLDQQELDPSPALAKIADLEGKVRTSADSRDADQPFYLSPGDVHGDDTDDWDILR